MELPGGKKLLSGWVAEIDEKRMPGFGIKSTQCVSQRRGAMNLKRGSGRLYDRLRNFEPAWKLAQKQDLHCSV
jgi:hypothetical protein